MRAVYQTTPSEFRSWAEISSRALRENVRALRARAPLGSALMAVVKADAYGHSLPVVVPVLNGIVDWFAVANLHEARRVRALAPGIPVLILSPALPFERADIAGEGFVPIVSSLEEALGFAGCATSNPVAVHLAVDTGMGRVGVDELDAFALATKLRSVGGVQVTGVASHFPSADEDDPGTRTQADRFARLVVDLRAAGLVQGPAHIANSAGLIGFPDTSEELFRAGLALYGCAPRPEFQAMLRPVLAWKTRVALVRECRQGQGISYGSTFVTPHPMRVATLAVGYADGYRRHLSGKAASVLIGGKRCPVLGRVTMDQIMVDVNSVPQVEAGSEVVLLGEQGGEKIDVSELAALSGTIPWDIFTGLGNRVSRIQMP